MPLLAPENTVTVTNANASQRLVTGLRGLVYILCSRRSVYFTVGFLT